jgi:hypothetical protein
MCDCEPFQACKECTKGEVMGYRRNKVDNNQKDIVKKLREIPGVTVDVNHNDILVGYKWKTMWYEIKNPDEITKSGKIKHFQPSQKKLVATWTGHYKIVSSLDEILKDLGIT